MSKTAIVKTGEQFFIKQLSKSQPIKLDKVIFANVSGINGDTEINVNGLMPDASQIVHTAPVTQSGLLNDKTVVYSVILDTSIGDFSFNYIGLVNSETNTLCMVMHTDLTKKIKTAGQRQGNTITESIWLEIDNASESTGITVNAQTWQIDYSKRLAGEDERIRLTNYDLYSRLAIHNGFAITKNGNQLTVSTGLAYVAGLRVEHTAQTSIKVESNQSLYIDAWLAGTVTGEWSVNYNLIAGTNLRDYEKNGFKHYVERVASIDASGKLVVVKPRSFITTFDLSSATDSTAENKAATSLAVKKAYDLASNALKKGDYGIGSSVGAIAENFDDHLVGGFYQCRTTDFSDLQLSGNSTATLLAYPSNSTTWKVEQLSVVNSKEPRIYYRCDTKEGKQKWHEAITTANIKDFAYEFKGNLVNKSLNELTGTEAGIYFQGRNVQATTENNYPINEAGTLQVLKNGADGAGCCQIYTAYRNARQFIRNYRGGTKTWEPWVEFYTTANRELTGLIDKFEASGFESRVYSHDKRFYLLVRDDGVVGMFNKVRGNLPWWFAEDGVLRGGYVPADRVLNLEQYVRNFTLPPGIPLPWPQVHPPAGWFECNGAQFDINQFPRLASAYPAGRLPDLRGEFIRGWDNARGADPHRVMLSWQNCEIQQHIHGQNIRVCAEQGTGNPWGSGGGNFEHDYWFNTGPAGGNETRPRNVAFMYIVKAE